MIMNIKQYQSRYFFLGWLSVKLIKTLQIMKKKKVFLFILFVFTKIINIKQYK